MICRFTNIDAQDAERIMRSSRALPMMRIMISALIARARLKEYSLRHLLLSIMAQVTTAPTTSADAAIAEKRTDR